MRTKFSIKHYIFYLLSLLLILCGLIYLLSSCEKDMDGSAIGNNTPDPDTDEMITVNFTMESLSVLRNQPAPVPRMDVYSPLSVEIDGVIILEPFKEVVTEDTSILITSPQGDLYIRATLTENTNLVSLRAMPLDTGTKIRLIAHTISSGDTTVVGFTDYEITGANNSLSPISPPLLVTPGSYKFVAYSYNETDAMPAYADITSAIASKDVLWGESDANISPGNATVHIQMEHLFSRIILHAEVNPLSGNIIYGIDVARFEHSFPSLVVRSKNLIPSPTNGLIDFEWPSSAGYANIWNSIYHTVYTNGEPPVVLIDSVTINTDTYYGPFPVAYATALDPGKEYTLIVKFILNTPVGYSAARITWDDLNQRYTLTTDPRDAGLYFRYGSVVGLFSGAGRYTQDLSQGTNTSTFNVANHVTINVSTIAITKVDDVPYVNTQTNIDASYHNATNVKAGRGDPCRLIGLDLNNIKNKTAGQLQQYEIDNGLWRLPTGLEQQQFTGHAPDLAYSGGYWWWAQGLNPSGFTLGIAGGEFPERNHIDGGPDRFLPAAGDRSSGGEAARQRIRAVYLTSTLKTGSTSFMGFHFDSGTLYLNSAYSTNYFWPARCVPQ